MDSPKQLIAGTIVRGPLLSEPIEIIVTVPMGESFKLIGKGLLSGRAYDPIVDASQLAELIISPAGEENKGGVRLWKLAQSLFALHHTETDEKRWVDGVLAQKKGLGFG